MRRASRMGVDRGPNQPPCIVSLSISIASQRRTRPLRRSATPEIRLSHDGCAGSSDWSARFISRVNRRFSKEQALLV